MSCRLKRVLKVWTTKNLIWIIEYQFIKSYNYLVPNVFTEEEDLNKKTKWISFRVNIQIAFKSYTLTKNALIFFKNLGNYFSERVERGVTQCFCCSFFLYLKNTDNLIVFEIFRKFKGTVAPEFHWNISWFSMSSTTEYMFFILLFG